MRVSIEEKIKQSPELALAIAQATNLLEEELGASAELVTSKWCTAQDEHGRPLVNLSLSDFTGDVMAKFAPSELKDVAHMQLRLHRLWGDLLQVRSGKQVEKLKQLVHDLEGE